MLPSRPLPTRRGDVLILSTRATFQAYIVGVVSHDDQQDFSDETGTTCVTSIDAAITAARSLGVSERRIFSLDLDSGEWTAIE